MTLIHLLIGLALLPLILWIVRQVVPIIRKHVGAASSWLGELAGSAFGWASNLLLVHGTRSSTQAVSQSLGAVVMLGAMAVMSLSEYAFCTATLGPIFGYKVNLHEGILAGLHAWIGLSVILASVVFGLVITDLFGWTCVTKFAFTETERGRVLAFWTALLCFLGSVGVAVVLAVYRSVVLELDNTALEQGMAWSMPLLLSLVLITLAFLLLIGIFFALMSLETFLHTLMALVAAMVGVVLGAVKLVLLLVDIGAELVLACMPAPRQQPGAVQTGLTHIMQGIRRAAVAVGDLVRQPSSKNGSANQRADTSRGSTSDVSQNGRSPIDTAGLGVGNHIAQPREDA